jgi:excisionase family DNA binding protein
MSTTLPTLETSVLLQQAEKLSDQFYEEFITLQEQGLDEAAHASAMICYTTDILIRGLSKVLAIEQRQSLPSSKSKHTITDLAAKPLLSVDEVRELTGLMLGILLKAIAERTLKATFIGRRWHIKRDDLDNYLKSL